MMLFVNKWCVNTFLICTPFFFLALLHWLGGIYSSELNRNVLRMYIKLQEFPLILGLLNFLLWIGVEFCKTFSLCLLGWSQVLLIWGILLMSFWTKHSSVGKSSACNAGDPGLIPGSGKAPGEGNDNLLQCSCLQNPMDRGAWQATVHGVERVRHDLAT